METENNGRKEAIGGWLAFFLVAMMLGSIISAVMMIAQFNLGEYGGNWFLALVDPIFGIMLFVLACYALYAFIHRKPDAVFLGKTYVVAVFVSGLIALAANSTEGGTTFKPTDIARPLIWGIIWFTFLSVSKQVERVIPTETRSLNKSDWWILGTVIGVPVLCLTIGMAQQVVSAAEQEKKKTEFLSKVILTEGEYTDGRIVFACPYGFECEQMESEGVTIYNMETETQGITIVSEYNGDDSQRCADNYWRESEEDALKQYRYISLVDEVRSINGNKAFVKTGKYESKYTILDSRFVYRRFAVIFNENSGKVCLVNCFDQGDYSYFEPFLKSIRFEYLRCFDQR